MSRTILFVAAGILAAVPTVAAPSIAAQGVKNAASFSDPRLPNGSVAQGSIFNIFGSAMGPATISYATSLPLPTTLSGTSISVTVNGTTEQCVMFYTSAGQVAAILPSTTPIGTGTITVSYNGSPSPTAPVTVVPSSPGIFSINQQGNGTGVILDANNNPSSATTPFQTGQTVVAWGTGLGPIAGADNTVPPSGNLKGITATVNVGGVAVTPVYAGRAGFSGEDQINFAIPSGLAGCNIPVSISVTNGSSTVTSNTVAMAVGSNGSCTSTSSLPAGISSAAGALRIGTVLWNHSVTTSLLPNASGALLSTTNTADQGEASFENYSVNPYATATGIDLPYGACVILPQTIPTKISLTGLDAGPSISVSGNGANRSITETTSVTGSYYNIIGGSTALPGQTAQPLFFNGGSYSFNNGSGGKDVGAFSGTFTVPSNPFTWTNYNSITSVSLSSPLTVTWTGGDPSWDVFLTGGSLISTGASGSPGVNFECRAHDSDGMITVPVSILSQLPPSGNQTAGANMSIPLGSLTMLAGPTTLSTATVSGLDYFWWEYSVEYQNSSLPFK
jgi:uncharacterized protein (TIGR03437 family)